VDENDLTLSEISALLWVQLTALLLDRLGDTSALAALIHRKLIVAGLSYQCKCTA
jgi:hypothetical protein